MITYKFTQSYGNRNTHHRSAYNYQNEGREDRKRRKRKIESLEASDRAAYVKKNSPGICAYMLHKNLEEHIPEF